MAALKLAVKLADEFGVSVAKARRLIDDVGVDSAQRTLDDAAQVGNKTVSGDWWKAGAIGATGAGAVGGGVLLFNEQEKLKAKYDAEASESKAEEDKSYNETVRQILEDDELTPKQKEALIAAATAAAKSNNSSGGDGGDDDGGGGIFGDVNPTTLIVMMIVLIFALKFGLESDD